MGSANCWPVCASIQDRAGYWRCDQLVNTAVFPGVKKYVVTGKVQGQPLSLCWRSGNEEEEEEGSREEEKEEVEEKEEEATKSSI